MARRRPLGDRARRVGARAALSDRRPEGRSRAAACVAFPGGRSTLFRGAGARSVARGRGRPGAPAPRGCPARDRGRPRARQRSLLRERRPRADRSPPRPRAAARGRCGAAGRPRCAPRQRRRPLRGRHLRERLYLASRARRSLRSGGAQVRVRRPPPGSHRASRGAGDAGARSHALRLRDRARARGPQRGRGPLAVDRAPSAPGRRRADSEPPGGRRRSRRAPSARGGARARGTLEEHTVRLFDPHVHMASRVTDDYEGMALAGIVAVCEPAFWQGQPRTSVGTFVDYFDLLLGFERYRASQYGIRHVCTIALNPKEANDGRVNQAVIEAMPRYLEKDGVVAVGEVGFDDQTATEERFFRVQIELAMQHELPLLVHLPHRDKVKGLERTLAIMGEMKVALERVLIDHNTEETVPLVVETGHYIGFSIYPDTKMTEERVGAIFERYGVERMIIDSAADWGRSDPLKVPRTVMHLRGRGFPEAAIETLVWKNPVAFFSQTGRLDPAELEQPLAIDRGPWEGNTLLRGGQRW